MSPEPLGLSASASALAKKYPGGVHGTRARQGKGLGGLGDKAPQADT